MQNNATGTAFLANEARRVQREALVAKRLAEHRAAKVTRNVRVPLTQTIGDAIKK